MAARREVELEKLRAEYDILSIASNKLLSALRDQMTVVVEKHDISLAVPIETRVKSWESLVEKIDRKDKLIASLSDITDLAGLRLITLFQGDVEKLDKIIRTMLNVSEAEDTSSRLDDAQFGYRSNHYVGRIPESWLTVPSYEDLGELGVEVQICTLPQHMWAAASHKLQYKREDSAPPRLRRAINRVSAILETVDLEFTRILDERDSYFNDRVTAKAEDENLNVDNIANLLSDIFPPEHKTEREPYDALLDQLSKMNIITVGELKSILLEGKEAALEKNRSSVTSEIERSSKHGLDISDRLRRGIFFKHVGLARQALRARRGPLPGDSAWLGERKRPQTA